MAPIRYQGKEGIFEYHKNKWYKIKEKTRTELHDVAFFEPSWGVLQLDSLKQKTITLQDFMKGIDPSDALGEKGQLYYLTNRNNKRRLARTSELTKIANNNNKEEEILKLTELDE